MTATTFIHERGNTARNPPTLHAAIVFSPSPKSALVIRFYQQLKAAGMLHANTRTAVDTNWRGMYILRTTQGVPSTTLAEKRKKRKNPRKKHTPTSKVVPDARVFHLFIFPLFPLDLQMTETPRLLPPPTTRHPRPAKTATVDSPNNVAPHCGPDDDTLDQREL